MRIVQALRWLRDTLDPDGETGRIRDRLVRISNEPDQGERLRADLSRSGASSRSDVSFQLTAVKGPLGLRPLE
jgi:hypothetical protein